MPVESQVEREQHTTVSRRRRGLWGWVAIILLLTVCTLAFIAELMLRRASPILKGRVIETLSTRFNSHVELDSLSVSLLNGLEVSGRGLRIFPPDDVIAAGANAPLISLDQFSFHAGFKGLFVKPTHIDTVHVRGMNISIPPRQARQQAPPNPHRGKVTILVDTLVFDDSHLIIQNSKPDKDPKDFVLRHIEMHDVGPDKPWTYDAYLSNAIPRGEIHATGNFGPWDNESPGDSIVNGHYLFDHADLNTIKGIGGMLHSTGEFQGQLNRIEVQGTTDTPDFSLDTANHPMPLHTVFHAIVDGTSGDTYLDPVDARLGNSPIHCQGAVVNIRGKGHIIDLDASVSDGRIEDFLKLAVKTQPTIMTGRLQMRSHIHIRPGKESVTQKLGLKASFTLRQIHFTNPETEDKIDMLSLRTQGDPKEARPGAPDVHSTMSGSFVMNAGRIQFSRLDYAMPGAQINLNGHYNVAGEEFDFTGKVRTEAKVSQMIASRWKSILLKPVDPFFKKDGAGAEIPVHISGTKDKPNFALDLHHKAAKAAEEQPAGPSDTHK